MDDQTFNRYIKEQRQDIRKFREDIRKAKALIEAQHGPASPQPSAPSYDGHHHNDHYQPHNDQPQKYLPAQYPTHPIVILPTPYQNGHYVGDYQQHQYQHQQPHVVHTTGEDSGCCCTIL